MVSNKPGLKFCLPLPTITSIIRWCNSEYSIRNLILLLLILFIISTICIGQDNSLKFRRLTIEDGLSQSSVHSIAQDKEGYIWFATASGLNRFDGYEFKVFKNQIDNDSSLSNNRLAKLFVDSKNRLWIGTEGGGLNLFNDQSDTFKEIPLKSGAPLFIHAIAESMDSTLWIGTRNGTLYRLIPQGGDSFSITTYPLIINELPIKNGINDIIFYQNKLLLATSGKGMICFDPGKEKFSEFDYTQYGDQLRNCIVNSFYNDKNQNLWIATDNSGIFIFQNKLRTVTRVDFESFGSRGLICNNIYSLTEDQLGYLWVGTKGGLNISEKKLDDYKNFDSLAFTRHVFSPSNQKSLSNNFVRTIYEDRSGIVWIGTTADGVNQFNRSSDLFNYFQKIEGLPNSLENEIIMSVYDDDKGALWIGSDAGLIKFNKHKKSFEHFWNEIDKASFNFNTIMSITELDNDKLLLGTYGGGLIVFDQVQNQYLSLIKEDNASFKVCQRVLTTYKDQYKNIWVGTDGNGVIKFRYNKNFDVIKFTNYIHSPGDTNSLSHNDIWNFFEDEQGTLWIGTVGGLNQYHPASDKFTSYKHIPKNKKSLSSNRVYCIENLDSNRLIIGTDNGLNIFDKTTREFEYFTEKDGLPDHVIYGVLKENDTYFWLSTNNGISRFDHQKRLFKNFSSSDGLPSNEFNSGAYYKNSKGELFFGSTRGLLWFDPSSLQTLSNKFIPPIVITDIEVNGIEKLTNLHADKDLILKHNQNTITLSFASLDFTSPLKNQYSYKIDYPGQVWTNIGNRRFVTFSNLAPGKYKFLAKGSNSDGIWNETPVSLNFIIHPPWWQTWWAYLLYGLFVLALFFTFYRLQLNKELEATEKDRLTELDTFKSRFYTNITHEFRTPLTVILGMTEQIREHPKEWLESGIMMIKRNANNLLQLVNQMLDLSKLEAGMLMLDLKQNDIISFLRYIVESFHSLSEHKKISIHFLNDMDQLTMDYDADKITKIVSNLLFNAIKFTPEKGNIYLFTELTELNHHPALMIKIKDTGIGISPEQQLHIFDRFYQGDDTTTRKSEGTGIGLAITQELVKLMNGRITVQSDVNKGSEFTIVLPITKEATLAENLTTIDEKEEIQLSIATDNREDVEKFDLGSEEGKGKPTALVVEDNNDVVHYLKACLQKDYSIKVANNGQDGIVTATKLLPDIIISDIMMTEKNGYQLCNTLKNDIQTSHIPIILLTAKAGEEDKLEGLESGADAYLTKPFNEKELRLRIDNLIRQKEKIWKHYKESLIIIPRKLKVSSPDEKFLTKALDILEKKKSDPSFDTSMFLKELGISRAMLHVKLKALTGQSTTEFIRTYRLKYAAQLIQQNFGNVTEVAYESGFNDQSYFTKSFKSHFGVSPSEYPKKIKSF